MLKRLAAVLSSLILAGAASVFVFAAPAHASGTLTIYNSGNSDNKIKAYNDAVFVEKYIGPGSQVTISDAYDAARIDVDPDGPGYDIGSYRVKSSPSGSYSSWRCGEPRDLNPYSTGAKYTGVQTSRYSNDCI